MAGLTGEAARSAIDAYLDGLPPAQQSALSHLRAVLKRAAPEAEEIITYAMPGIGQDGALVSYRAFSRHCSLFPMGDSVFVGMAEEIAPWRTSKGTLQFLPSEPLPEELVIRIVRARVAENAARRGQKRKSRDG